MVNDNKLLIRIEGNSKSFLDELKKVRDSTEATEKVLSTVAKSSAIAFAGFTATIAAVTKEFADYETALVGVGKTTDIAGDDLERFGREFQKLSSEIPIATNELLGIAQAAGQLGVEGEENLLKFTETVAKLGVATDLSGEEAATALTRILNVTNEGVGNIDRFGSVIVELGNNFAATESEIVRVATEVSRATAVFGVGSTEAAGLAAAIRSVGIRAELGGSVVGKAFLSIQKAISAGGDQAERLSRLTGIAGDQLEQTFAEDSVAVFELFLEGLSNVEGGTAAVFEELEAFGLKGDEVNKVLPVLAQNNELVARALQSANKEFEENNALNAEADKAFQTLNSEFQKLVNVGTTLAVSIGEELAPTIKEIIIDTREFLAAINENSESLASNIAFVLKWGAAITGAVASIASFLLGAVKISGVLTTLISTFGGASLAASGFVAALTGPVGIAVAGVAAIGAGIIAAKAAAAEPVEPRGLEEINRQLALVQKRQEEIRNTPLRLGGGEAAAATLDSQIERLTRLRQEALRASQDFGTGSFLVRPEADTGFNLGADAFGLPNATVDVTAPLQTEDQIAETRRTEEEKTRIVSAEAQKRIDALQAQNESLLRLERARNSETTAEAQALAVRRQQIEEEFIAARLIANEQERELALSNLNLKHAAELESIKQQQMAIEEAEALSLEKRRLLEQQLETLRREERALLTEEDLVALEERLLTEEEVRRNAALVRAEREVQERNQRLKDEQQFGQRFAAINAFFRNQDIQNAKTTSGQLIQLTQSRNKTLSSIGKAAASVNAAIATAEGAIKAYSSLAGIPIVGPALGAAAAGALIAFGVEQQANILSANRGGLVTGPSTVNGQDNVPAMLTAGELVVPRQNFEEVVDAVAATRGFVNPEEEGTDEGRVDRFEIALVPEGDFIGMIEQRIIERQINNTGVE